VFNPKPSWKFLGRIITINHLGMYGEEKCFCSHIKIPERHFYIKNLSYPVNEELLKMLNTAGIKYILIPEQGKHGFKAYVGAVKDYLKGGLIDEPLTEKQRSIPLENLDEIKVERNKLQKYIYG
jgi:hypothetical protein